MILGALVLSACGSTGGGESPGRAVGGKVYRVGVAPWVMDAHQKKVVESFLAGLEELGYNPNTNLEVKILDAGGSLPAQEQIVRDLTAWQADLIYAMTAEGALAAKSNSAEIPVVFSGVAYPQKLGLVERLEFSATNAVGIRGYIPLEEQMAFLFRLVPREIKRLVVCLRSGDPDSRQFLKEIRDLALKQNIDVVRIEVSDLQSLERGLADAGSAADAFYLCCDDLMQGAGAQVVIGYATPRGIPTLSCGTRGVEKGALAGAVVDEESSGRMAAAQAAQILSGRTPTSLQTLTASPPRLVVNRTAARGLGVRIPPTFLGEEVHVYE